MTFSEIPHPDFCEEIGNQEAREIILLFKWNGSWLSNKKKKNNHSSERLMFGQTHWDNDC